MEAIISSVTKLHITLGGRSVKARYFIKEKLDGGIFIGEDNDGKQYYVKYHYILREKNGAILEPYAAEKIESEITILKRLQSHPNIIELLDTVVTWTDSGIWYIFVNEMCPFSLFSVVKKMNVEDQEKNLMWVLFDVLMALIYLHSLNPPVIMRNICMENLMIGSNQRCKITNFSSCTVERIAEVKKYEIRKIFNEINQNTPAACRAPEQVDFEKGYAINEKVDVWSVGVLMLHYFMGFNIFEVSSSGPCDIYSNRLSALKYLDERHDLSPGLKSIAEKCFEIEPDFRLSSSNLFGYCEKLFLSEKIPYWPTLRSKNSNLGHSPLRNLTYEYMKKEFVNNLDDSKEKLEIEKPCVDPFNEETKKNIEIFPPESNFMYNFISGVWKNPAILKTPLNMLRFSTSKVNIELSLKLSIIFLKALQFGPEDCVLFTRKYLATINDYEKVWLQQKTSINGDDEKICAYQLLHHLTACIVNKVKFHEYHPNLTYMYCKMSVNAADDFNHFTDIPLIINRIMIAQTRIINAFECILTLLTYGKVDQRLLRYLALILIDDIKMIQLILKSLESCIFSATYNPEYLSHMGSIKNQNIELTKFICICYNFDEVGQIRLQKLNKASDEINSSIIDSFFTNSLNEYFGLVPLSNAEMPYIEENVCIIIEKEADALSKIYGRQLRNVHDVKNESINKEKLCMPSSKAEIERNRDSNTQLDTSSKFKMQFQSEKGLQRRKNILSDSTVSTEAQLFDFVHMDKDSGTNDRVSNVDNHVINDNCLSISPKEELIDLKFHSNLLPQTQRYCIENNFNSFNKRSETKGVRNFEKLQLTNATSMQALNDHTRQSLGQQLWRSRLTQDGKKTFVDISSYMHASGLIVDMRNVVLESIIGNGTFATVYKAVFNNKVVAVKILVGNGATVVEKSLRDFKSELSLLGRLSHPNIIDLIGSSVDPLCIIIEYCSRGNLMQTLINRAINLSWPQRKKMCEDIARGMNYLHSQNPIIIHRDLKSLNILIDDNWTCKVSDFGLSRLKAATNTELMTGQAGTYHWMSPEVINSQHYTEKADVYSFGIILWEIYMRRAPYEGMQPAQVIAAVLGRGERPKFPNTCPPLFYQLVSRCWSQEPSLRPSFDEFLVLFSKISLSNFIS